MQVMFLRRGNSPKPLFHEHVGKGHSHNRGNEGGRKKCHGGALWN